MLPNYTDFLVGQEQYQHLLREAEKERLIQIAKLRLSGQGILPRRTVNWLGAYVVKLGLKLQANRSTEPTCCNDCCLVELKANVPV